MPVPPESEPAANLRCPACRGQLFPRELECVDCGLHLQASYPRNEFARLDDDALHLLRIFVACEGRIRDMERALGVSYPTVKSRLAGLRETLGFGAEQARRKKAEPKPEEAPEPKTASDTIGRLERGEIDFDEAMRRLQG
ncbi:MAG: DUF2089 domain-containing protein [Gammaproteobacteria bacterium]|nr:DUF2089 domain-containing protein [Gammaproteobacteria bacterium]